MILQVETERKAACFFPSSLKICAQVMIKDSSGELWMTVPDPKPVERLP